MMTRITIERGRWTVRYTCGTVTAQECVSAALEFLDRVEPEEDGIEVVRMSGTRCAVCGENERSES